MIWVAIFSESSMTYISLLVSFPYALKYASDMSLSRSFINAWTGMNL
jgi:hypothetical protein